MDPFWNGFHKESAQKKEAVLGAAIAHLGQNAILKKMLKSRGFSKSMAKQFQEGAQGKNPSAIGQFFSGIANGATLPEAQILKDHMREFGGKATKALREQGVSHLSPRDMILARNLTKGKFSKLLDPKHFDPNNKTHVALLNIANDHMKTGITPQMLQSMPRSELTQRLSHVEKAWSSKNSPLTSNILSNVTKNTGRVGRIARSKVDEASHALGSGNVDLSPKSSLAGNLIGSAATGIVDPATGALNASKAMTSNPIGRRIVESLPFGKRLLQKSDEFIVKDPMRNAAQAGMQGQRTNPIMHAVKSYGGNAVAAEAANTANQLGLAAHRAAPQLSRAVASGQAASVTRKVVPPVMNAVPQRTAPVLKSAPAVMKQTPFDFPAPPPKRQIG